MAPSTTNTKGQPTGSDPATLTDKLAVLCQDEETCLSRTPGTGEVKPRAIDPNEKPRTAGARTAGG